MYAEKYPNYKVEKTMTVGEVCNELTYKNQTLQTQNFHTATAVCQTDCVLASINRIKFMCLYLAYLNTLNETGIKFLKRFEIFANIPNSRLTALLPHIKSRVYDKGENIFTEGDPADFIYLLKEGEVELSKVIDDAEEKKKK